MIYIAHRALFNGWDEKWENHPDQIRMARANGFDCEVDLRLIDGKWFLGHDEPTHEVTDDFIHQPGLWIHCKNREALFEMAKGSPLLSIRQPNFFWHDTDEYTVTSHGHLWTYPGKIVDARMGIVNQPEWTKGWKKDMSDIKGAGVCSKFVSEIRDFHNL
jgi:hypothetical protein